MQISILIKIQKDAHSGFGINFESMHLFTCKLEYTNKL